jgi:hypothetical protein
MERFMNFEPDFDTPDRPGLISRQEAAELAGIKEPPRQVSQHNGGLTYSDDGIAVTYDQGMQWPKATVTWTAANVSAVKVNWNKLGTITLDSMRFGRLQPIEDNKPPSPDDAPTRALKARQARNTGPKRPDAGHSKRKRKHRG